MRRARGRTIEGAAIITAVLALTGAGALAAAATLAIATHAPVTDVGGATTHASIVVGPHARAVYTLTGDSARHPECTTATGCVGVWPPVTASSARSLRLGHGIHGRLSLWRHDGIRQVILSGHPLYTYAGDRAARQATGEGIVSFGGTWHVLTPNGKAVRFRAATSTTTSPAPGTGTGTAW